MKELHPLKLERIKRGWSQYHLCFISGVPQPKISYAERGYPALNQGEMGKVAEVFDLPINTLFPKALKG